jgi:hypothetical protein
MRLAWPGVVLIGGIGGAIAIVLILWLSGCGGQGVDEGDYVAHNDAVYRTFSEYPGATQVNSYSIGIPGGGAFFHENGPPYKAFDTWRVYQLPSHVPPQAIIRHYHRVLRDWKWHGPAPYLGRQPCEATFVKGTATVYVTACAPNRDPKSTYEVSVDYLSEGLYGGG